MELTYRHRQHHETDPIHGLTYPEARNRYVDESWHDQDDPPEDGEMVSSTSVERSHAVTSSIEETHASKQQTQSRIPMKYPSKEIIQIDKREWDDILAFRSVERNSLVCKISKKDHKPCTTSRPCCSRN